MVDFSPDGRLLAVKDAGAIAVWDVTSQNELKWLRRNEHDVQCLSFAPDGKVVAGYGDGMLLFWNIDSEKESPMQAHDREIVAVAFSTDGSRFAAATKSGNIRVWDYETRAPIQEIEGRFGEQHTVLSSDGSMVASTSTYVGPTKVWDVDSGDLLKELPLEPAIWVQDLAFSYNGETLAVALISGSVRLFNTQSWQEVTTYLQRGHQLNSIAFSPTDDILISTGDSPLIMAWSAKPMPMPGVLTGHPSFVSRTTWSPDGRVLGVGCFNRFVRLWDVETQTSLLDIDGNEGHGWPNSSDFFAFSPDGQRLAVIVPPEENTQAHEVHIWDIQRRERVDRLKHDSIIESLAYSPDGRRLAVGCDGTVHLWDVATEPMVDKKLQVQGRALCLAISPDSKVLACEDYGVGIKLWKVETGEYFKNLSDFVTPVGAHGALAFSPQGDLLAAAGYDGKVLLWDTRTWEPKEPLRGIVGLLTDLSFSPDGKRIAAAGMVGEGKLWSLEDGHEAATFPGFTVEFSPDGNTLAVGGLLKSPFGASDLSSTVRLYRAPTFKEIGVDATLK